MNLYYLKHKVKAAIPFIAIFFIFFVTNVPVVVTRDDELIFRTVLGLEKPRHILTFEEEIFLIKKIQKMVLQLTPVGDPIPDYEPREPKDLLKKKSGLCYDRSRTYDKVFKFLGFETRHVYILYPEHPVTKNVLPYWKAFFTPGTDSHAVTEVKTVKGWILVDSNSDWISITKNGLPINSDHIKTFSNEFSEVPKYFDRHFLAIRGLYSRRGQLYRPYFPVPQFNWIDFLLWKFEAS
jgi:hypothetical protein